MAPKKDPARKIVAENRLGTAYATMFTIQNYGLEAFAA